MENTLSQEKTKSPLTFAAKVLAVIAAVLEGIMCVKYIFSGSGGLFKSAVLTAIAGVYLAITALKIHKGKGTDYSILMLWGCFIILVFINNIYPNIIGSLLSLNSGVKFALFVAAYVLYSRCLKKSENKKMKTALTAVLAVGVVYFLIYPLINYIIISQSAVVNVKYNWISFLVDFFKWFSLSLLTISALKGKIAKADDTVAAKTKNTLHKVFGFVAGIMVVSYLISLVSCGGGSSSDGKCKFDGCNRKATGVGDFCDYHSKALNDIWDVQNMQD